MLSGKD